MHVFVYIHRCLSSLNPTYKFAILPLLTHCAKLSSDISKKNKNGNIRVSAYYIRIDEDTMVKFRGFYA